MPITNPFSQENEMDKMCGNYQLTRVQRLYAFGTLFAIGFVLSFLSTILLFSGALGAFAILYTLGNVISLVATGFLVGFVKQFTKMFDPNRRIASITFLVTMVLTLISAFVLKIGIITLLLCVVQYLALLWYSLSYIPFARDFIKSTFGKCF